jgi:hypothetical protein
MARQFLTPPNFSTPLQLDGASGTAGQSVRSRGSSLSPEWYNADDVIVVACSDEATAITSGAAKVTFRMPFAATLISVRASLTAATTGTEMQIDINEAGTSVFSTTLRINAGALTSVGATNAFVISDSSLADNAVMTIDVDQVGTGAKGLKVHMYLRRA